MKKIVGVTSGCATATVATGPGPGAITGVPNGTVWSVDWDDGVTPIVAVGGTVAVARRLSGDGVDPTDGVAAAVGVSGSEVLVLVLKLVGVETTLIVAVGVGEATCVGVGVGNSSATPHPPSSTVATRQNMTRHHLGDRRPERAISPHSLARTRISFAAAS